MSTKNDGTKTIKNPLFSASVTGATIEDFTQNALLLSAQSVPAAANSNASSSSNKTETTADLVSSFSNSTELYSQRSSETLPEFSSSTNSSNIQPKHFFDTSATLNTISTVPQNTNSSSTFSSVIFTTDTKTSSTSASSPAPSPLLYASSSLPSSSSQPSTSFTEPPSFSFAVHPTHSPFSVTAGTQIPSTHFIPSAPIPTETATNSSRLFPTSSAARLPSDPLRYSPSLPSSSPLLQPVVPSSIVLSEPQSLIGAQSTPSLFTTATESTSFPQTSLTHSVSSPSISTETATNSSHLFPADKPIPTSSYFGSNTNITANPQSTSHKNVYRRPGLKKPAYAQIPGLLTSSQPPSVSQTSEHFSSALPAQHLSESKTQPLVPVIGTSVSVPYSVTNTGLPYMSNVNLDLNPQTRPSLLTPSKSPFLESSSSHSSPVMAAMPIEEVEQTQNQVFSPSVNQNDTNILKNNIPYSPGYREVYHHWFYKREIEGKTIWTPFSMSDSLKLDAAFTSHDISPEKVVATDGGRYDVNILRRERYPVYWDSPSTEVRRCSWFHKNSSESHFIPYEENIATMLEEEFKTAYESNKWNKKIELGNGGTVILNGPDAIILLPPNQSADAWGNSSQSQLKPKVIKRGLDEFDIDEGEPETVDHLLFLVHGVGSACDLRFRSVEEVVDDFRSIALQLVQSHYRSSCERGLANRIEVLPIKWHSKLHSEETGIDKKLKNITLESIPRLRDFTNDTILDVLFYTSPFYCQTIIASVGNELNRLYNLFKQRNPSFKGGASVGGHSLGSLILFDLLSHQRSESENDVSPSSEDIIPPLKPSPQQRKFSRRISYMMSAAGTGQPQLVYPHLNFEPTAFFALGSPIGLFITLRGLDHLGEEFGLPTCSAFFNIFHPYDPVAYRIESLINPELANLKPVLVPHHKGRKRMHLELKETMARVGADLKQKLFDSMKSTINSIFHLSYFQKQENGPSLEAEVDRVLEVEINSKSNQQPYEEQTEQQVSPNLSFGVLNKGRRIDYVLQEAPLEFFNEYIFALSSHVCYWESEDTMLLMLKEIYTTIGISTDNQIPQQSMTIERLPSSPRSPQNSISSASSSQIGMDPTVPVVTNVNIGPPPVSGFVRRT